MEKTKEEEEGWYLFDARVDEKGRLNIPADIREEMEIYREPAKVSAKVKLVKKYKGGTKDGSV